MCRTSAAVCSHARGAGTVLISTTNLVTLPAPPLCAAGSAFAAAVALLVLCLSIVCVTVCLLLSVRVCLREQPKSVHVCMCIIVCQGVSFALLLSAPRVAVVFIQSRANHTATEPKPAGIRYTNSGCSGEWPCSSSLPAAAHTEVDHNIPTPSCRNGRSSIAQARDATRAVCESMPPPPLPTGAELSAR